MYIKWTIRWLQVIFQIHFGGSLMWFFWVYVLFGTQEKTMWYKIFPIFWFCIFSYTFREPILVKIWWKFSCKKIQSLYFDLNQKFISYKMKEMVLLTFCMSQFFDLGKIQPLKFFLRRKKNPASVPKSGVLENCLARVWLDWIMVWGQNTDFPEAKWLYDIIQQLFWSLNAMGIHS